MFSDFELNSSRSAIVLAVTAHTAGHEHLICIDGCLEHKDGPVRALFKVVREHFSASVLDLWLRRPQCSSRPAQSNDGGQVVSLSW